MVSNWLYPLSSLTDYFFVLRRGKTEDTSEASLVRLIEDCPNDEQKWFLSTNFHNVKSGHSVWFYYGTADRDRGIVARGRVTQVNKPTGGNKYGEVKFRWDLPSTHKLLADPLPGWRVREFIKFPAASVMAMPEGLVQLLTGARAKEDMPPLAEPSTIVYTSPRRNITVRRRHDALLVPVQTRLSLAGWKNTEFDIRPKLADLAMSRGSDIVLIEAKTVGSNSSSEVRAAFAQLAEYRWRYLQEKPQARITPWALFERGPKDDEVAFLEAHDILVSWIGPHKKHLVYGPITAAHRVVRSLRSRRV